MRDFLTPRMCSEPDSGGGDGLKRSHGWRLSILSLGLMAMASCSGSSQPTSVEGLDSSHGGLAVPIRFENASPWAADTVVAAPSSPTLCTDKGIGVMTIQILSSGGAQVVPPKDFSCQDGEGTLTGIPSGTGYQVVVVGRPTQGGPEVYRGTQGGITVTPGQTSTTPPVSVIRQFQELTLGFSATSITVGQTTTVSSLTTDGPSGLADGINRASVAFASTNPRVAFVEATGNVTAVGPGSTELFATYAGVASNKVQVTVIQGAVASPPFALAATSSALTLIAGTAGTSGLKALSFAAAADVRLTATCPSSFTCEFVNSTTGQPITVITPSSNGADFQLRVTVDGTVPQGTYLTSISGTGGSYTATVTLAVQVFPAAGALGPATDEIAVSVSPTGRTIPPAAIATTYDIIVTELSGSPGPVSLSVGGCPQVGTQCMISPSQVTPTVAGSRSTLTVTATPNTPKGSFTLTITAGLKSVTALLIVGSNVPGTFSPAAAMSKGRDGHTMTILPNGKVLVVGGSRSSCAAPETADLYDPATGTWGTSGPLSRGRQDHTAALLTSGPNAGKVLVIGGSSCDGTPDAAELYDPATNSWSNASTPSQARYGHTATILLTGPNAGKVLVAGGNRTGGFAPTVELYDPQGNSWTTTGALGTPRLGHTATLLPNGKVLIAGGGSGTGPLASAELYDPATGSWSGAGTMSRGRDGHRTVLLPNGKVLVVGGANFSGALDSVDIYDPTTNTWSPTDNLNMARSNHSAIVLPNGMVLVAGGLNGSSSLNSAELFDPVRGIWTTTGNLTSARQNHQGILLLTGQVFIVGGTGTGPSAKLASSELYVPVMPGTPGAWSLTGKMSLVRSSHTATLLQTGKVLISGGSGLSGGGIDTAELYDPSTAAWGFTGTPPAGRTRHTATLLPTGTVLVTGGSFSPVAELYNPINGQWTSTGLPTVARDEHTATLLPTGEVLIAGGRAGSSTTSAEIYNIGRGNWRRANSMDSARSSHTATLLPNGMVLVAGGYTGTSSTGSAELYIPQRDASGDVWFPTTQPMVTGRYGHTATLLPDGKVLISGGFNTTSAYLNSAELYDPATGIWSPTGSLAVARTDHQATLLSNGKVLVVGGQTNTGTATAELYDPSARIWNSAGRLATVRAFGHTATLLSTGQLLVAGGGTDTAELFSFSVP